MLWGSGRVEGRKGQVLRGTVGTFLAGTPGPARHHTHDLASLTAPSPTHDTTTTTTSSFVPSHSLTHRINKILLLSSSSSSTYFWCPSLGIYIRQITPPTVILLLYIENFAVNFNEMMKIRRGEHKYFFHLFFPSNPHLDWFKISRGHRGRSRMKKPQQHHHIE